MSSLISFAFNCAGTIGNLLGICLGVSILISFPCFALYLALDAISEQ